MKKTLLLAGLLLVIMAGAAAAAGVSITWGRYCWGDPGATANLTWACNTNTFTGVTMSCSFEPGTTHTNFVGVGLYLEGLSEAATVPDWWALDVAGTCRENATVTFSADFTTLNGTGDCQDLWGGGAGGGGIGLYSTGGLNIFGNTDPNRMHINAAWAVPDPITETAPGTVYWCGRFSISAAKTLGCGSAGCLVPAIWGFQSARLAYQGEAGLEVLDVPYSGGNQCLTWQGTSASLNCGLVPARNTTWGQLKSLYR